MERKETARVSAAIRRKRANRTKMVETDDEKEDEEKNEDRFINENEDEDCVDDNVSEDSCTSSKKSAENSSPPKKLLKTGNYAKNTSTSASSYATGSVPIVELEALTPLKVNPVPSYAPALHVKPVPSYAPARYRGAISVNSGSASSKYPTAKSTMPVYVDSDEDDFEDPQNSAQNLSTAMPVRSTKKKGNLSVSRKRRARLAKEAELLAAKNGKTKVRRTSGDK